MKVPKMYKSSDLYDAGTDVIYDDDSKLEYAPFIYATTKSGDGGDGGDDEEGEEGMVVHVDFVNGTSDVSYATLENALNTGKIVYIVGSDVSDSTSAKFPLYLMSIEDKGGEAAPRYGAVFADLMINTEDNNIFSPNGMIVLVASTDSELMTVYIEDPMG